LLLLLLVVDVVVVVLMFLLVVVDVVVVVDDVDDVVVVVVVVLCLKSPHPLKQMGFEFAFLCRCIKHVMAFSFCAICTTYLRHSQNYLVGSFQVIIELLFPGTVFQNPSR
jgi:hypothetical protein